ncbi:hypothetical protein BH18ACT5_BH18ACT5_16500 [soil metagenome]
MTTPTPCAAQGIQAVGDADDEVVPGEVYFWLAGGEDFEVRIESDGEQSRLVEVDVFVDPSPTILEYDQARDGEQLTLEGVGDTAVFLSPSDGAALTFAATGLTRACAIEAHGAPTVGTETVWPLAAVCRHSDQVSLPGLDIPLVVFNRTEEAIEITLQPN